MKQTCAQFLANKLIGATIREWDRAPHGFDFEVRYLGNGVSSVQLKEWVLEFFTIQGYAQCGMNNQLVGTFVDGVHTYLVTITHSTQFQYIQGTFMLFK